MKTEYFLMNVLKPYFITRNHISVLIDFPQFNEPNFYETVVSQKRLRFKWLGKSLKDQTKLFL